VLALAQTGALGEYATQLFGIATYTTLLFAGSYLYVFKSDPA
jgi:hypothetical protein